MMDFSHYSLAQLQQLAAQVKQVLIERDQSEFLRAKRAIEAIAAEIGIPLTTLFSPSKARRPRGPALIRYQHPEYAALHWAGRGRTPHWVQAWEAEHGTRDGIFVAAQREKAL